MISCQYRTGAPNAFCKFHAPSFGISCIIKNVYTDAICFGYLVHQSFFCFTGQPGLYVPRTGRLLRLDDYFFGVLLTCDAPSCVMLCLWAGNVYHRICLGGAPRGMLLPQKTLTMIASFLCLFESFPICVSLIDFGDKLSDSLFPLCLEQVCRQ